MMTEPGASRSQIHEVVFRSTSDGIITTTSEGVLEHVNPAGAAMLALKPEDMIGKTPRHAFNTNMPLINLFTRSGEQTLDVRLPRRRLAVGFGTTLESGERLVMLQDVTEKRDLENRREALIKAMSHDLRNPISAISGFADLVIKFGDLNDQQTKFVTRIRQTATKLYDVVGDLVDLAWIEAGMPLEHKPIQLRDVINDAVDRVTPLAHGHKIIIATSIQNPMPTVMGDPMRLGQVIYNLLHNAILYSHPEQTVVIHGWGDTTEVYCSVADRGIGISDDELQLIFDRMYRSRDEHVRNLSGGGLGLTMAKTIIARHGGDIWASSNLGEGSTFTFVLPVVQM
ncbi:MAG: ATP-binding protein [bacterium]|nr:ATP-binding protein [bacterium]